MKNAAFNLCDCYDNASQGRIWSNWVPGPWAGAPAPKHAPFGCGTGAGTKGSCESQAQAVAGPIAQAFGWAGVAAPPADLTAMARRAAEQDKLRPAPAEAIIRAPSPPAGPVYHAPDVGSYLCVKDIFGRVDCYLLDQSAKVWSNYQHGPWAGFPAPDGAPFGAGVGA